jgi:hypothetical protein
MAIFKFLKRKSKESTILSGNAGDSEDLGHEEASSRKYKSITGSVNGKWGVTGYYSKLTETKRISLDQILKRLEKKA